MSAGGGAVVTIFNQAMDSKWVGDRAAHLDRGSVLLHDGLPDQRVAHAVRVQPRPCGAGSPAVVGAEQEQDSRQRRHGHCGPRGDHHPARSGRGRHQRRTRRRSRSSRWSRSASSACTCASRCRSTTGGRPATRSRSAAGICAATTSGWRPSRSSRSSSRRSSRCSRPRSAVCRGTRASSGSSSTTPRCWSAAC